MDRLIAASFAYLGKVDMVAANFSPRNHFETSRANMPHESRNCGN